MKCLLKICPFFLLLFVMPRAAAQTGHTYTLSGKVMESGGKSLVPLEYATVALPEQGAYAVTDKNGSFTIGKQKSGTIRLVVRYTGMVEIDTLINLKNNDVHVDLVMSPETFRLKEVLVTATSLASGESTASKISRNAIDHLQATSLADVLSLLPGGLTSNQNLNNAKQVNIRNASSSTENINAFGVSIISEGAPISNNANLQTMNPAVAGATAALSGGSAPSGGTDLRLISTDNIESVEVITGIPSVRYGDITSGAIIINSKAGRMPLRIMAKSNPNVYGFTAAGGFGLGDKKGSINISGDYTHNTNDIVQSYQTYQRSNVKVLYSNRFFDKWTTNSSLSFVYGADRRKKNPDDLVTQLKSNGDNIGGTFNTNGLIYLGKSWITNLRYVGSASYTYKKSYLSQAYSSANYVYSSTINDNTTLTNFPGQDVWDSEGNKITNFTSEDAQLYARELPSAYVGGNEIEGKEVNLFGKVMASLYKKIGQTNHAFVLGVDFKSDGNEGKGKTFDPSTPPYRNLSAVNASFRPRAYKDIPYVKQFGAFVEESFRLSLGERELKVTGGLRYDRISVVKDVLSPRVNAYVDVVPGLLRIRGGYGVLAKAPSVLYLYPEKAYFEYVNINELSNTSIPENERLLITTTRVFDTQNKDLKIARNKKAEVGFNLMVGKSTLTVTGFHERLQDGYAMATTVDTYQPLTFNEYSRVGDQLVLSQSNPVLAKYYTPTNNLQAINKGIEFDLNLGRFEAIRTAFSLNGMWLTTKSWSSDYTFFDDNSGTGGKDRTHIALYEKGMRKSNDELFTSSVRITHNIPEIGFVVTLTGQAIWNESQWYDWGNDSIPVKYLSKEDGKIYDFTPDMALQEEFKPLIRQVQETLYIKEVYAPALTFNINVTKELGDFMRVSFFANNMFRSYPSVRSKRTPSNMLIRKQKFFFGLELSMTL